MLNGISSTDPEMRKISRIVTEQKTGAQMEESAAIATSLVYEDLEAQAEIPQASLHPHNFICFVQFPALLELFHSVQSPFYRPPTAS